MPFDPEALKVGIFSHFSGNGTLTAALTGGLHWRKYPEKMPVVYPYASYFFVSTTNPITFNETSDETRVQFSVFPRDDDDPNNPSTLDSLVKKLTTAYDLADLTVAGHSFTFSKREVGFEIQDEDGTLQHTVDFMMRVSKNRV